MHFNAGRRENVWRETANEVARRGNLIHLTFHLFGPTLKQRSAGKRWIKSKDECYSNGQSKRVWLMRTNPERKIKKIRQISNYSAPKLNSSFIAISKIQKERKSETGTEAEDTLCSNKVKKRRNRRKKWKMYRWRQRITWTGRIGW